MLNNEFNLLLRKQQYTGTIGTLSFGGAYLREVVPHLAEDDLYQVGEITLKLSGLTIVAQCSISFVGAADSKFAPGIGIVFTEIEEPSVSDLAYYIENIQPPFVLQHQVL